MYIYIYDVFVKKKKNNVLGTAILKLSINGSDTVLKLNVDSLSGHVRDIAVDS